MKLRLNHEFFIRHLFVTVLMFGLGCWFAYDGFIGYPSKSPQALYAEIEKSEAPSEEAALRVYTNAIQRQKEFMALAFLAALIIGGHLFTIARIRISFDDDGFSLSNHRYAFADVAKVDDSLWAKKGICRITMTDGSRATLDSWHHNGAKELRERILSHGPNENGDGASRQNPA